MVSKKKLHITVILIFLAAGGAIFLYFAGRGLKNMAGLGGKRFYGSMEKFQENFQRESLSRGKPAPIEPSAATPTAQEQGARRAPPAAAGTVPQPETAAATQANGKAAAPSPAAQSAAGEAPKQPRSERAREAAAKAAGRSGADRAGEETPQRHKSIKSLAGKSAGGKRQAQPAAQVPMPADAGLDAMLAAAGFIRGPDGLMNLQAASALMKPNEPIFKPAMVASLGGRLGQGSVSMDAGAAAVWKDYDLKAAGLGAASGRPETGPVIPAGKAPGIPASHVNYIVQAARESGIEPALLAATAARESNFRPQAYRAEPHLRQVMWRAAPSQPPKKYFDGSIGPTQVLRSNFRAQGIDSDAQAYNLANNYRTGARIIRSNLDYFPGNEWKAVSAYNVGKYGAQTGRVPANNYTNTILSWRQNYRLALSPYR